MRRLSCIHYFHRLYTVRMYVYIYIDTYIYDLDLGIYIYIYMCIITQLVAEKNQGKPYCMGLRSTNGCHPTLAVQRALGDFVVSVGTMVCRR